MDSLEKAASDSPDTTRKPCRRSLRQKWPSNIAFSAAGIVLLALYFVILSSLLWRDAPGTSELAKRRVEHGIECEHRKHQINAFMAAFWGGIFAADQWYAKNYQLAIPKFLFMWFFGFGIKFFGLFTLSLPGVWWLCDVCMWGVGFYTTGTNGVHFGNPTQQCKLIGW